MSQTKAPLVFLGNESLSSSRQYRDTPIFQALLRDGWPIKALVVKNSPQQGRRRRLWPIITIAQTNNVPIHEISNPQDLESLLRSQNLPRLGLMAGFGVILTRPSIDHFQDGLINVHPSLLPLYQGASPIETTILRGDDQAGVSLLNTHYRLDRGPVYCQQSIPIPPDISKLELTVKLGQLAAEMVSTSLVDITTGKISPQTQSVAQAIPCSKITVKHRLIDWRQSAIDIERQIRSHYDWPGSWINLWGSQLIILRAQVVEPADGPHKPGRVVFDRDRQLIIVQCGQGSLGISHLKPLHRKPMRALDAYNAHRSQAKRTPKR